jgi:hypothetical protein
MDLVVVESPFAGDVERNLRYVRACMHDAFLRGEAPFASHALYTQPGVLDDDIPLERAMGIEAGFLWGVHATRVIFYVDFGWSNGMRGGLERARQHGKECRTRTLGAPWSDCVRSDALLGV